MLIHNVNCKEVYEPYSYEEIVELVRKANIEKAKIHPIGTGSHHIGRKIYADMCISLLKFSNVIEVSKSDLYVTAQAGIDIKTLQDILAKNGLFLPFTYSGTLGGLASTNSPSLFSLLYPYPKDFLLGAKIVTGMGEIIKSGSRTTKFSSGYKIWKALSGALGSLGIYLELTFRLIPIPERIAYAKVDNPLNYISLRPWGILSMKENGNLQNFIIFGGFSSLFDKISREFSLEFINGLPDAFLNCERIYGIISSRGEEIELLKQLSNGIAYVGSGYVRSCDPRSLELRKNGYTVVVEKGCVSEKEECFGFKYQTFNLLKTALDPNNVFAMGLD